MIGTCATGVSTKSDTSEAAREVFERASSGLEDAPPHIAFLFFTPEHRAGIHEVVGPLSASCGVLLGSTAEAVIGESQELESGPAMSLWVGYLPGARVIPFSADLTTTPDGQAIVGFPLIGEPMNIGILLADGLTFPTQALISSLNGDHPGLPIVGGQSSGGMRPGEHFLVLGDEVKDSGAVGLLIGGVDVDPLVSQGCRPIGEPFTITSCEGNIIHELGNRPALERLKEAVAGLDEDTHTSILGNLNVGLVIDESGLEHEPGDFLIRGLLHANMQTGSIVVGEQTFLGQTIQFQLRDPVTATYDLEMTLDAYLEPAVGSLLFTCNGRGSRLFEQPHHDVTAVEAGIGPLPVGGMFCQGEIGPVAGRNYLHGFTASMAVFR